MSSERAIATQPFAVPNLEPRSRIWKAVSCYPRCIIFRFTEQFMFECSQSTRRSQRAMQKQLATSERLPRLK